MALLWRARANHLFPMPPPGTDQLSMLRAAAGICHGHFPGAGYMYSPAYTLFLAALAFVARGDILIMRILQAAVCAFVPVVIYKLARVLKCGREAAALAALLYCFYGASALVSLSFLRAAPLALCFLLFAYYAIITSVNWTWKGCGLTAFFATLCVLGRENLAAVLVVAAISPFVFQRRMHAFENKSKYIIMYVMTIILILPIPLYNYFRFGVFAIIPGAFTNIIKIFYGQSPAISNSPSLIEAATRNIPLQFDRLCCSYEIPNSLSVYAHADIISFMAVFVLGFNVLLALALVGSLLHKRNPGILFVALCIVVYFISLFPFAMFYRYRLVATPLLCVLAGIGLRKTLRLKSLAKKIIICVCVAVFALLTYVPPDRVRPVGERRAVAAVLVSNGRFSDAEAYLRDMAADGELREAEWRYLARALHASGDRDGAAAVWMEYLDLRKRRGGRGVEKGKVSGD